MMTEIKEGCVVALKASGGPSGANMTVGEIKDDKAECYWFVAKELRSAQIPVCALVYLHE